MRPCLLLLRQGVAPLILIPLTLFGSLVSADTTSFPRVNIKRPIGLFNGSTYSKLPGTGSAPSTSDATRLLSTAFLTATANLATFHDHVFPTLCPSGNTGCLETCQTYAEACADESDSWSSDRKVYQTSVAQQSAGGSMPVTTFLHIQTQDAKTIWSYNTSWMTYEATTEAPAYGAGSHGLTATTIIDGDKTLTTSVFKTGTVTVTYIKSIPYAKGGTGKPVSTRTEYYNTFTFEQTSWYDYPVSRPTCSFSTWMPCKYSADCNKCTISGGTVQLLYFPVPRTTSGGSNFSMPAPTAAPAVPETAVYKNFTMTSPSVYISFQTAYAVDECGSPVGQRYPGAILPLPLSDLSSYGTMYSSDPLNPAPSQTPYLLAGAFDLADLDWPYPLSAYTNQLKYALGREIFSIITSPYLAVPKQIRSLDAAWNSCELDWEGLYDPPTALRPADVVAKPTMSEAQATYTSAGPVVVTSLPEATKVRFTAGPEATKQSTALSTVASQSSRVVLVEPTKASESSSEPEVLEKPSSVSSLPTVVVVPQASEQVIQPTSRVTALSNPDDPTKAAAQSVQASTIDDLNDTDSAANTAVEVIASSSASSKLESFSSETVIDVPSQPSVAGAASSVGDKAAATQQDAGHSPSSLDQDLSTAGAASTAHDTPLLAAIGTQTITESSAAQTISGQLVSLGETKIILGTKTIGMPRIEAGTQHLPLPYAGTSEFDVAFLAGPVTKSVVDGAEATTQAVPALEATAPRISFTLGSKTYTAFRLGSTGAIVGCQTMTAGGSPLSLEGGIVSMATNNNIVFNEQNAAPTLDPTVPTKVFTLGGKTYTAARPGPSGEAVVGTLTMSAGGSALTLEGGTASLASNYDLILVDDITASGPSPTASTGAGQAEASATTKASSLDPSTPRLIITLGSHTYTAVQPSGTEYAVLDGKTFSIGQAISVPGGKVSFDTDNGLVLFADPVTYTTRNGTASRSAPMSIRSLDTAPTSQVVPSGPIPGATTARTTTSEAVNLVPLRWQTIVLLAVVFLFAIVT